ncbi:hypothetical protein GCM10027408_29130 [Microbacterium tumbae]
MKSAAARTAAGKTAAAKSTAARSAAKTTAAKTAAAKAAAEKAAAESAAAADAASPTEAGKESGAAKSPARARAAAKRPAAKSPATKRPAANGTAARKPAAKRTAAPQREVAADAAAPTLDVVAARTEGDTAVEKGRDDETAVPVAEESAYDEVPAVLPGQVEAAREAPAGEAPADEALVVGGPLAEAEEAPSEEAPAEEPLPGEATAGEEPDPGVSTSQASEAFEDVESASGADALRVRGLVKEFGDHRAVNGVDLTVPAGSFYGIVGPNGAGKTTTLSIIAGLLRPDAGTVHVSGIDQAAEPLAAKRVMGVLPDRLRTFDRLTGRQLLHYYGLLRGLSAEVIEKRSGDLARAFDLGDALSRVVSDYSAGMTKKLMLAGAMIHSPRVLVLDEPFEAVDPVSSGVILDILRAYVAHGGTVILSSHGMDLVERVCSRVAIIVDGEVLAEGTVDEVRAGQTLESRFVELAGSAGEVEGLEWLHTFSD